MPNSTRRSRWSAGLGAPEPVVATLVFVAAFLWFQGTIGDTLELRDEGYLLYNISRVAGGEIPHVDFDESYGPGVYLLSAPVWAASGGSIFAIREFLALIRAGAVVCAYLLARRVAPRPFALVGAALATAYWGRSVWTLNTPYAALFTIPICTFSMLLLLRGRARDSRGTLFASGLVCGAGLLFKWTLAAVTAWSAVLAIAAAALLEERDTGPGRGRAPLVALGVLAGAVLLVPFWSILVPFDYALHFAPLHATLALVAFRFARHGDGRAAFARMWPQAAWYTAGFAVLPLATAAVYGAWGALDDLVHNTVVRPLGVVGYYFQTHTIGLQALAVLAALVLAVGAALTALRRSWPWAASLAVAASLAAAFGAPAVVAHGGVSRALDTLMLFEPTLVMWSGVAVLGVVLRRPRPRADEPHLDAVVALLLFQGVMAFQIYPRGAYNVTLMLGTLAPLVAWLMQRAAAIDRFDAPWRRVAAFAATAAIPLLFVADIAREVWEIEPGPALRAPVFAGLRPKREVADRLDLGSFDEVVTRLRVEPGDTPVFAIVNEPMLYLASERPWLFADHASALFLVGWGLLRADDPDAPGADALIERLDRNPRTIVVKRRGDRSSRNFGKRYPEVVRWLSRHYEVEARIGSYRLLRRRAQE